MDESRCRLSVDFDILNALSACAAVVDGEGRIVAVNGAWSQFAKQNGCDPERVRAGVRYLAACQDPNGAPLPEASGFRTKFEALMAGDINKFSVEYPCHYQETERWFLLEATLLPSTNGALLCHREITHAHHVEAGRREFRALFSALFHGTSEAMFLCDSAGQVQQVNPAFTILFGVTATKLVGRNFKQLRNKTVAHVLGDYNADVERTGKVRIFEISVKIDTGLRALEVTKGAVLRGVDGEPLGIWGAVRDISAARATECKIVDLSDHERQRLAALVHEGPCQSVTGIWLYASTLFDELTRNGLPQANDARAIVELAKDAGQEMKQMLKEFSMLPMDVDDGDGLLAAIGYMAEQVEAATATKCILSLPDTVEFDDPSVSRHLFWIAQEAVRNATKHAKATRLQIKLARERRTLVLTVRDNGIGFEPKPQTSSGIGLQVMRVRARAIGATLEFRRLKPRGTAVVCTLPPP